MSLIILSSIPLSAKSAEAGWLPEGNASNGCTAIDPKADALNATYEDVAIDVPCTGKTSILGATCEASCADPLYRQITRHFDLNKPVNFDRNIMT